MDQEQRNRVFVQRNFVTNFVEFGALQRVRQSWMLLGAFESGCLADRASAALGIFQNLLNQYEDVLLWLEVVLKWQDATTSVTSLVDQAHFHRNPDLGYYRRFETKPDQMLAFQEKLKWQDLLNCDASGPSFATRVGLPYFDDAFCINDFSAQDRDWLRSELDSLASLKYRFLQETRRYLGGANNEGPVFNSKTKTKPGFFEQWPIWNKMKHGMFVTLTETEEWTGATLQVHLHPDDLGNSYTLEVESTDVHMMTAKTFVGAQFIGRLLAIVATIRYLLFADDRTPVTPSAPWLNLARVLELEPISRHAIEGVVHAARVPGQRLHVDLAPNAARTAGRIERSMSPRTYWIQGIKLGDDWQRT
jgi:hypothetical protein